MAGVTGHQRKLTPPSSIAFYPTSIVFWSPCVLCSSFFFHSTFDFGQFSLLPRHGMQTLSILDEVMSLGLLSSLWLNGRTMALNHIFVTSKTQKTDIYIIWNQTVLQHLWYQSLLIAIGLVRWIKIYCMQRTLTLFSVFWCVWFFWFNCKCLLHCRSGLGHFNARRLNFNILRYYFCWYRAHCFICIFWYYIVWISIGLPRIGHNL